MSNTLSVQIAQHVLTTLTFVFGIFLVSQVIRDRKSAGATWGWILTMIFIPYLGVVLYLFFGGRKLIKKASKKEALYATIPYGQTPSQLLLIERLLMSAGGPVKTLDNSIQLLDSGEQAFAKIVNLLNEAKRRVWITTYILSNDSVGREILEVLTHLASQRIEVCLLLDGMGSLWTSRKRIKRLRSAGGKVAFFLPLFHIPYFGHSNLRNHRKIMLIDDTHAVVGGMNLANDYLGPDFDPHRWIDLAFCIQGGAVKDLAEIFRADWKFAAKETLPELRSSSTTTGPHNESQAQHPRECALQVVGSGPDVLGDPLYDSILSAIFAARTRIWMATPYFIPDSALAKALELACRRGVDVRLITPKKSDHVLADFCRAGYLRQLTQNKGQLYFDSHTMMHAKVTLFDDQCAVIGSANLDMRSLFYNYEVGIFVYTAKEIKPIEQWFTSLQAQAQQVQLKRTYSSDILDGLGKIIGPLV